MDTPASSQLPPRLGPACIGLRVVVRYRLPTPDAVSSATSPTMTDVLGVMRDWGSAATTIETDDGSLQVLPLAAIVSGKAVPPRPSRYRRLSADSARAFLGSPDSTNVVMIGSVSGLRRRLAAPSTSPAQDDAEQTSIAADLVQAGADWWFQLTAPPANPHAGWLRAAAVEAGMQGASSLVVLLPDAVASEPYLAWGFELLE